MTLQAYSFDDRGFRTYDPQRLSVRECPVISKNCREKAGSERFAVIAVTLSSFVAASGIVFLSLLVAKVATPLFIGLLAGYQLPAAALTAARVSAHALTYVMGLIACKRLLDGAIESVIWHRDYATHLDQQAIDIDAHKADLES